MQIYNLIVLDKLILKNIGTGKIIEGKNLPVIEIYYKPELILLYWNNRQMY